MLQHFTIIECSLAYLHHRVRYLNGGQIKTFVESIFAYLGYTVWNDNACQFIATFECLFLNYGRSLGNDSNTVFYFVFCHRSVSRLPVHREVLCLCSFSILLFLSLFCWNFYNDAVQFFGQAAFVIVSNVANLTKSINITLLCQHFDNRSVVDVSRKKNLVLKMS